MKRKLISMPLPLFRRVTAYADKYGITVNAAIIILTTLMLNEHEPVKKSKIKLTQKAWKTRK